MSTEQAALDLAPASAAPAAPPAAPTPASPQQQEIPRREATASPPVAPNGPIQVGELEFTADELTALAQRHADEAVRKATLPASPDAYEATLPDNFVAPEGVKFEFRQDDPLIAQAKAMAHAKGWSQSDLSDALGLYAATQVEQETLISYARAAELEKLGVNGTARVDAVTVWLRAYVGADLAGPMVATLATANQVAGFEKLIMKISSQGSAPFSQSHRTQPDPNKIDGYENMSFEQRREAQDRLAGRR
jgi:hypothetical protein